MKNLLALLTTFTLLMTSYSQAYSVPSKVPVYTMASFQWELESTPADPFTLHASATITHTNGTALEVPLYYTGNNTYALRFTPPQTGQWTILITSESPELDKKSTSLSAISSNHKGGIVIAEHEQGFRYSNGEPYFAHAFELDWLFAIDKNNDDLDKTKRLIEYIGNHGFNQIVFNFYAYDANWGDREAIPPSYNFSKPDYFPFGGSNSEPDFSTLNLQYFEHIDRVLNLLNENDIVAHMMIYVWNKHVTWPEPGSDADNRFFDYVVKRYQAYPNLIWDVSKEALAYGRDDMSYISERITRLRKLDGHKRLVTVHDYNYCNAYPDLVDFISVQDWTPEIYSSMRAIKKAHPLKPIFNIENGCYDTTIHTIFAGAYSDSAACLDRHYKIAFAGVFNTYYWQNLAWYEANYEPWLLEASKRPPLHWYKIYTEFFSGLNYNKLAPTLHGFGTYALRNNEGDWFYYVPGERDQLSGDEKDMTGKRYQLTWLNAMTGETTEPRVVDQKAAWLYHHKPEKFDEEPAIAIFKLVSNIAD